MSLSKNWEVENILLEVAVRQTLISKEQLTMIREHENAGGVAVWGTGQAGNYVVDLLLKNNIHPVCIVDSFEHPEDAEFKGIPLLSSQKFFSRFSNVFVVIACLFIYEIDKLLEKKGYQYLPLDTTLLNQCIEPTPYEEYIRQGKEAVEKVYALLADEQSKFTYEQLIKYRLTYDQKYIEPVNLQKIYFENDVIPSFSGKTFIDCGAFTGDTLLDFFNSKSCRCETYYALEPSHKNFEHLQKLICTHKIEWAVPLEVGAWDKEDVLHFSDSQGMSSISVTGQAMIHVDTLDHLFCQKKIDFIKMDIEGSEKQAILGAKKIIQEQSPILAISIYHRPKDFWELPLLVRSINKKYRIYIFATILHIVPIPCCML